ncbi:YndJ family transporter [Halobacillus litoralis]|nr:YndJ family transporter [Halobacillus litoralis]
MQRPGRWLAVAGFFLWLIWKFSFSVEWLEFSIGFSLFILVPLLLEEAVKESRGNRAEHWLWQCLVCLLPFSIAGVLSLSTQAGWEAAAWGLIWFLYTLSVAVGGVWRFRLRQGAKVEELSIDVGFLYLAFAGLFLFISRLPIKNFGSLSTREWIVLALFFHGVAFLLAVITGFFGRYRKEMAVKPRKKVDRPYRFLVIMVLISPVIGFFSLLYGTEAIILSVAIFSVLLIWMCLWWFWLSVEFKPWVQTALILTSLMGFSIVGSALWKGLSIGRLSSVGMLATIPPYGFFSALLFSWLIVFAWRGVNKPRRMMPESDG